MNTLKEQQQAVTESNTNLKLHIKLENVLNITFSHNYVNEPSQIDFSDEKIVPLLSWWYNSRKKTVV